MEAYVRTLGVHLLDIPHHLDIEYTYYIPETIDGDIPVGGFVLVPFGGANKKCTALVTSIGKTDDYSRLKPILAPINEQLSLSGEMMALVHFLCDRTLCTVGDAVRRLIPAVAFERADEIYFPLEKSAENADLNTKTASILEYIIAHAPVRAEKLTTEFGADIRSILRRLIKDGYIGTDTVIKEARGASEEIAVLNPNADAIILLKPRTPEDQRRLFAEISENGRIRTKLLLDAGYKQTHIKALEKKGLIFLEKKEVIRNPYGSLFLEKPQQLILNEEQKAAYERLSALLADEKPHAALLYGVTGSGKTGVILSLCERALEIGKTAIVLIPEIALTWQSVTAFTSRFGARIAVMHSGLSDGERFDAYKRIRRGEIDIVLGTRSAIFAPIPNLGLIVIDEEQESAYKSDMSPKYHARDIAKFRAASAGALLVMASATPSVESFYEAQCGKYELVKLTKRYHGAALPKVKIADMRGEPMAGENLIGKELRTHLCDTFEDGKQSMLFLNRRGFNSMLACRACGEVILCPNCSVSLTHHKTKYGGKLVCHYCGHKIPVPRLCPKCGSEHLSFGGYGTQMIEEELRNILPDARTLRMDADTTREKFSQDEITDSFSKGGADILVGTQMIAKGHNFPGLQLVGVVAADNSLFLDDFRANERTFSLITQVIGRAGRAEGGGIAVIQTLNPDNETIRLSAKQDYDAFYKNEIAVRRALVFPPFCDIAVFSFVSEEENELKLFAEDFTKTLAETQKKTDPDVKLLIFGPFEAPVYKVKNKYRIRTVIKFKNNRSARALFAELLRTFEKKANGKITLSVDINPTTA